MPAILEDVVALMQSKPNPADLPKSVELFTGGLVDLTQRLRNLEYHQVAEEHRLSLAEADLAECKGAVAAVSNEHRTMNSRLEAVEKAPADLTKKLEEIEKRIRTLEGAVGSTAMAAAKKPADTSLNLLKPTDPVKPVA
jgi:chromosome segregation ATPase